MCNFVLTSKGKPCPEGDMCVKAHNRVEDFYHPEKYKSKFCQHYPDNILKCDYGNSCAFAHNR
jgi:hypothetical protein